MDRVVGASLVEFLGRKSEFRLGGRNVASIGSGNDLLDLRFHARLHRFVAFVANSALSQALFRALSVWHVDRVWFELSMKS